jgi:hypothetical protein
MIGMKSWEWGIYFGNGIRFVYVEAVGIRGYLVNGKMVFEI